MGKVVEYKKIVRELLLEIAAMLPAEEDSIENQVITDDEHGHYLLFYVGWEGKQWQYASLVHIDVKQDGKVWLQHDGTDFHIAERLNERGIPKKNIVIGFQPPHARALMDGYAAA